MRLRQVAGVHGLAILRQLLSSQPIFVLLLPSSPLRVFRKEVVLEVVPVPIERVARLFVQIFCHAAGPTIGANRRCIPFKKSISYMK